MIGGSNGGETIVRHVHEYSMITENDTISLDLR